MFLLLLCVTVCQHVVFHSPQLLLVEGWVVGLVCRENGQKYSITHGVCRNHLKLADAIAYASIQARQRHGSMPLGDSHHKRFSKHHLGMGMLGATKGGDAWLAN